MSHASDPATAQAVVALLEKSGSWSIRSHAARALGRIGKLGHGETDAAIDAALRKAITGDSFALVREAALMALVQLDKASARALLERVATSDREPRVRGRARELAGKAKP
jgi:HEAT repeat protein